MRTKCMWFLLTAPLVGCTSTTSAVPVVPAPLGSEPTPSSSRPAGKESSSAHGSTDEDITETVPIAVVKASAIYAPDPDPMRLIETQAAHDMINGVAKIGFCVDVHGKTTNIRTLTPFPKDPQVDEILEQTVTKWRFKPKVSMGRRPRSAARSRSTYAFSSSERVI